MENKRCPKCKQIKSIDEFYKNSRRKDGHGSWCKLCKNKQADKYNKIYRNERNTWLKEYRKRPERLKQSLNYYLKRKYGITFDEYDKLLKQQNNCCIICGKHQIELKNRLSVDHNHKTGDVRGLLCVSCNSLIGNAKENIQILKNAIEYLKG